MKTVVCAVVALCAATGALAQTDTTATDTTSAMASPAATSDAVKRAVFCTAVADREPVDEITTLAAPAASVTFFTEIVGMAGKTITHRWMHGGQAVAEVPISIGADRWRCYSTKTLAPDQLGAWTVEVIGEDGAVLARETLAYTGPTG